MRKRNNRVRVRVNNEGLDYFKKLVERAMLLVDEYHRQIVKGIVPIDRSPICCQLQDDVVLYHVGDAIN